MSSGIDASPSAVRCLESSMVYIVVLHRTEDVISGLLPLVVISWYWSYIPFYPH